MILWVQQKKVRLLASQLGGDLLIITPTRVRITRNTKGKDTSRNNNGNTGGIHRGIAKIPYPRIGGIGSSIMLQADAVGESMSVAVGTGCRRRIININARISGAID